jgi:outer membrane receptor protein involved in Fe transport
LARDWSLAASAAFGTDETTDNRFLSTGGGYNRVTRNLEKNTSRSYELGGEGPLFSVGGDEARLAVGVGERNNEYRFHSEISGLRYGGEERARYTYAELNLPFVSPSSSVVGVHRLEVSAALRSEDYDSFGQVTTPKLGLIYAPSADVTLKASWGKSFKAPTMVQRNLNRTAYLWTASMVGGAGYPANATALMSYGGNPDLQPERAETWSASINFHPRAVPGLEVELTGFGIDYKNRVMEPVSYMQALSNPAFAEFVVLSPTSAQINELLADYGGTLYNYAGAPLDPAKIVALIYDQHVNVARQKIRGLDLSASYALDLEAGYLTIRGSGSWLDSSQQTSMAQPEFDLAGTAFNPADFTGRFGAVWKGDGLTASAFVNHTTGVETYWAASTIKTASFTTVDATLNYDVGETGSLFSGVAMGISVQNLFNKAPPIYAPAASTYIPYDATNYSGIGRFVSVSVSKRF